jgi:PhnB protein
MPQIQPYIGFGGKTTQAMNFYQHCFGGDLNIMLVSQSGAAAHMPPEMQDNVMHASLSSQQFTLLASDVADVHAGVQPVSLMVQCNSEAEINQIFERLSDGANITQPLMDSFWGSRFGNLTDKYGIQWMFNWEKNAAS